MRVERTRVSTTEYSAHQWGFFGTPRGLGLATAATSATFFPHLEQRIRSAERFVGHHQVDRSTDSFHSRRKYPSSRSCVCCEMTGMNSTQLLILHSVYRARSWWKGRDLFPFPPLPRALGSTQSQADLALKIAAFVEQLCTTGTAHRSEAARPSPPKVATVFTIASSRRRLRDVYPNSKSW